jgi:hypothetical protein
MSDRVTELLFKAVRQLSQEEQDEVLTVLLESRLTNAVDPATQRRGMPMMRRLGEQGISPVPGPAPDIAAKPRSGERRLWGWPTLDETSVAELSTDPDAELKVLPVRLPVADYDRLRTFSRTHGFSMAVIIRTLVERFLEERTRRPDQDPTPPAPGS